MRLYLLFVYKNNKAVNSMGIKGTIPELFKEAERITTELLKDEPKAEIRTKMTYWD